MKKTRLTYATGIVVGLAFLSACGDEVTNVTQKVGLDTVAKYKDLDKCEKNDVGILVYVSDSAQVYTCTEDGWISTNGTDGKDGAKGAAGKDGASCSVKALRSGDGYKVICNGDSIGVLLNGQDGTGSTGKNGEKGASGEDGASCSIEDDNNGTVKVTCGTTSTTIYKALCGSTPYDPARMLCTNDEVTGLPTTFPIGTMRSCSSVTYDPSKQLCVNGTLVDIGEEGVTSFCGSNLYNPEKQACFDGTIAYLGKGKLPSYGFYCTGTEMWCKNETHLERVNTGFDQGKKDSGYWLTFDDAEKGGHSAIQWSSTNDCKGLCGTATLDKERVLDPTLGLSFLVGGTKDGETPEQVDVSERRRGMCVTYTSELPIKIVMDLGVTSNKKMDNDLPNVILPSTSILDEKCFLWSQFKQDGTGLGLEVSGSDAAKYLTAFKFQFSATETKTTGDFNIVRLTWIDPYISSSCSDMWCGSTDRYGVVDTYMGISGSGYWFDFNDKEFGGNTIVSFPDVDENKYGNFFGPLIEKYEGIKGRVSFGDAYAYPYGGVAYNVARANTQEGQDMTNWFGFCMTYKSTSGFSIELVPQDEKNVTNYDNFRAQVPKASRDTTVNFEYAKFKQGKWGTQTDLSSVLARIVAVRFRFEGSSGTDIDFEIKKLGSVDGCR